MLVKLGTHWKLGNFSNYWGYLSWKSISANVRVLLQSIALKHLPRKSSSTNKNIFTRFLCSYSCEQTGIRLFFYCEMLISVCYLLTLWLSIERFHWSPKPHLNNAYFLNLALFSSSFPLSFSPSLFPFLPPLSFILPFFFSLGSFSVDFTCYPRCHVSVHFLLGSHNAVCGF